MRSEVYLARADRNDVLPTVRDLLEKCQWRDLIARMRPW